MGALKAVQAKKVLTMSSILHMHMCMYMTLVDTYTFKLSSPALILAHSMYTSKD